MAEIVNLNQARKVRRKTFAKAEAEANRVLYGLTKGQREVARAESERLSRGLDQTKRED